MRKLTAALCFTLLGAVTLTAQAAEVAVLDWRQALLSSDAAQRSMSRLESQISGQQQEAESLGRELSQMQQRLQQGDLPEAERQALMQEFQQKGSRFEQLRQQIMEAQMRAEQGFLQEAEPKLEQAVERVISRHGIQVLVEPQGVLHSSVDLPDLTDEVTEILNTLN
ncbi:OmpH family outer membrane protein [Halomonas campisalis]|uniref:OmpH family outer membrane protein n=1 Tax=Billgrantia campisalis TaxID=74661 RepID=A0ABS9PAP0_9GAMM|nr:OmpH family outer membrane protein [Halomonas campisalis]MCG6658342.1 OmpH family outer membrane protein [Halomonas campisalis]MDR5863012.1 OmpH family outer membrane protein [Halomonas campisalis]